MMSAKISAGKVPPSTGAPANSVSIGVTVSAWPTQTQAVISSVAPQNQASPLSSVVPVLPQVDSPVAAFSPVPELTTVESTSLAVAATAGSITCLATTSFSPLAPVVSAT